MRGCSSPPKRTGLFAVPQLMCRGQVVGPSRSSKALSCIWQRLETPSNKNRWIVPSVSTSLFCPFCLVFSRPLFFPVWVPLFLLLSFPVSIFHKSPHLDLGLPYRGILVYFFSFYFLFLEEIYSTAHRFPPVQLHPTVLHDRPGVVRRGPEPCNSALLARLLLPPPDHPTHPLDAVRQQCDATTTAHFTGSIFIFAPPFSSPNYQQPPSTRPRDLGVVGRYLYCLSRFKKFTHFLFSSSFIW